MRTLLSDEVTPATAEKTLVLRQQNRYTKAEVQLWRLGKVPRGPRSKERRGATPWLVVCRSHGYATKAEESRAAAELLHAPFGWCEVCHQIMLGESPKVGA